LTALTAILILQSIAQNTLIYIFIYVASEYWIIGRIYLGLGFLSQMSITHHWRTVWPRTFIFCISIFIHLCQEWTSQLMPEEFLPQFLRVIWKGRQDVLTPLGWPKWRTTYHPTTSVWKMPLSWTGYSKLHTEMMQAEQWWWWYSVLWCKFMVMWHYSSDKTTQKIQSTVQSPSKWWDEVFQIYAALIQIFHVYRYLN